MIFLQQNSTGASDLRVLEFASGLIHTPLIGAVFGQDVSWCAWANETRLVCALADIDHRRGVGYASVSGDEPAIMTFIAIEADGTQLQRLEWLCEDNIDWTPEDPAHILMYCPGRPMRIDIYTRQMFEQDLHRNFTPTRTVTDGRGTIRVIRRGTDNLVEHRWYSRQHRDDDWERFRIINAYRFEEPFRPMGFGENSDELFHIAWNSETWSLFALDTAAGYSSRPVFAHPAVDVAGVERLGGNPRVVAATYYFNGPQRLILDERVAAVHGFVSAEFPDSAVDVIDESWDQNVYLVRVRPLDRAGEFYRVDIGDRRIDHVGAEYLHLQGIPLAPSQTIEITTSDGGKFSAHLTLPRDHEGPTPVVLIPRGTPSSLDLASPNYLVQYLAYSGYAVLRVNQRGPLQYGGGWTEDRVFVGRQQAAADIRRAGEYLVESGLALPGQMCALGWDVGAYAAFMSAILDPELFQCLISIRGTLTLQPPRVHDELDFNPLLEEIPPAEYADKIEAAVLLFDGTAGTSESKAMETLLRHAGQEVQLFAYDHADSEIRQGPYRIDMLFRIGKFLESQFDTVE